MRPMGNFLAWAVGTLVAYVFAVLFETIMLSALPVELAFGDYASGFVSNLMGLGAYAGVIGLGFLIAFVIASLVKAFLPFLSAIAYPVAGAAAIAVALITMNQLLDMTLISGTRSDLGFWLQCLAGALGGVGFELLRPRSKI